MCYLCCLIVLIDCHSMHRRFIHVFLVLTVDSGNMPDLWMMRMFHLCVCHTIDLFVYISPLSCRILFPQGLVANWVPRYMYDLFCSSSDEGCEDASGWLVGGVEGQCWYPLLVVTSLGLRDVPDSDSSQQ